ncbi:sigma-54 dependent transcriptional regulator [Pseudoxanthobacter sp. M-2]|uniref:sigma-54 interaction domain-containing protein n=1 Tax=Pseudoxanthobacter sp. M-2 TaxID=3078754 RepID=UPI0038FCE13E
MREAYHRHAYVPPNPSPRVLSLDATGGRVHPQTVRATAMVFEDPVSRDLEAQLARLAPSDASVLVVGETGTGKELVARQIHQLSARRTGPFVAVNCGALADGLVDAELFGHEKGAFTGALRTQPGWFEAANGGTLLLDEVGDLPLPMQVKLLRVLQEREVVRVGARTPIPVDVRVVSATNVDLDGAVASGRFREDLLFRLNVATVTLPPLRARTGDIRPLAAHFLDLYRRRLGRPELSFAPAALTALTGYGWPGNIRELENVVHNAVLLARGPRIEADELRLTRSLRPVADAPAGLEDALRALFERALVDGEPELFDRVTRLLVRSAFDLSQANQVRAAERLGLSRNAFRTQLAHLGVIPPRRRRNGEAVAGEVGDAPCPAPSG